MEKTVVQVIKLNLGVLSETRYDRSISYQIRKPIEIALQIVLSSYMRMVM